jgi:hypothetical protein
MNLAYFGMIIYAVVWRINNQHWKRILFQLVKHLRLAAMRKAAGFFEYTDTSQY